MKYLAILFVTFLAVPFTAAAELQFQNALYPPVAVDVNAASGLQKAYVAYATAGVQAVYVSTSGTAANVSVQSFGTGGASYSTPVAPERISYNGAELSVTLTSGDSGYSFTEGNRTTYYWIVDYSQAPFAVESITAGADQQCDRTFLAPEGVAPRMTYHGITARTFEIDRGITLSYTTLSPDEQDVRFQTAEVEKTFPYIDGVFSIEPPLCDTYLTLSGDRFLRAWGIERQCQPLSFATKSVAVVTQAVQQKKKADNELSTDEALGGSAPVTIDFKAAVTDAAVYTQWQLSTDEEFEKIIFRTSDLDFSYTFDAMGRFYTRFTAADNSGECEASSEIYSIYIGESSLRCPNAFSPGATEGVNDLWKVSYKSIVDYNCYIFNRWGEQLFESRDPSQGWDGKKGGKLVPAGVYYYVIKARGADGKIYNLSGDINILHYK